jgi:electron transfer flavoprotein beta subunit
VKLPDILKAKKKPLDSMSLADLGVSAVSRVKIVKTEPPAQRQKGIIVKDTQELVAALRKRGVL